MTKEEKTNKKETIQVGKEDFLGLVKQVGELIKEVAKLKQEPQSIPAPALPTPQAIQPQEKQYAGEDAFMSNELGLFKESKTEAETNLWRTQATTEFRSQLEVLMRKYQITQVIANIFKRL